MKNFNSKENRSDPSPTNERRRVVAGIVLVISLVAAFFPAGSWLVARFAAQDQLWHTLIIAGLLIAAAWTDPRAARPLVEGFSPPVERRLIGALLTLIAASIFRNAALVFVSFGLSASALLTALTGRRSFADASGLLLGGLFFFASIVNTVDPPLRFLASRLAVEVLSALGQAPLLFLMGNPEGGLALVLQLAGHNYEVATECNGFGLTSGVLAVAVFLAVLRSAGILRMVLLSVMALGVGIGFNALRIVAIALTAPHFPGQYGLVHEVVGIAFFWAGLALVWWATHSMTRRSARSEPATATE